MKRARGDTSVQQDDVAMDGQRRGAPCAALPARGPANVNGIDRPVTDNRTAYWTTIPARRTALQVGAATMAAACQGTSTVNRSRDLVVSLEMTCPMCNTSHVG